MHELVGPVNTSAQLSSLPGSQHGSTMAPHRSVILAVLSLTVLIINLDGTILNVALPTIVTVLHASSSQLQWMVDSYVIVLAGLLLIAGSLGDHFGRKWVYIVGLAVFAAGSAMSAFLPQSRPVDWRARLHGGRGGGHHALDPLDPDQCLHQTR